MMEAEELFERAEEARARSRFQEALEGYRKALEGFPRERLLERLHCLQKIGDCLRMMGEFEEAKRSFTSALELAEEGGDEL